MLLDGAPFSAALAVIAIARARRASAV